MELLRRLARRLLPLYPNLADQIKTAHLKITPVKYIYKTLKFSIPFSLGLTVLFFFVVDKAELPLILIPFAYIIILFLVFNFGLLKIRATIIKRQKEIDREVLFTGQFLLVKLYAGKPLINALTDTTKCYGIASKYMKEIVDDIETGVTIEDALHRAITYSPSEKLRKILFHISNALRLGIDVTKPLSSVLDEISRQQELEIKTYGKKLNTLVIFYMLLAVVVPSIGMTVLIVLSSFINLALTGTHFIIVAFFLVIIELLFISLFNTIRPVVNL